MSNSLDQGPIYTQTGAITQLEYATKCADAGSTIIAAKSKYGVVVAVEKPITSKLNDNKRNKRVIKLFNGVFVVFTGLLSDAFYVVDGVRRSIIKQYDKMEEKINAVGLKNTMSSYIHIFTKYIGLRSNGCSYVSGICDNGNYKIILTDSTSKSNFYKACCAGKGATRAKTELEKINFDELTCIDMADHIVRIMHMCYDPLKDKEFDIELVWMNEFTNDEIKEVDNEILYGLIDKYKNLTVEGE